jgi:hypothetical protein
MVGVLEAMRGFGVRVQSKKPVVRQSAVRYLAPLLAVVLLLQGGALVAHVIGNAGMIAFRNVLVAETARADTTWKPGAYPLFGLLAGSDQPQIAQKNRGTARAIRALFAQVAKMK